jgi:hypothetical protein
MRGCDVTICRDGNLHPSVLKSKQSSIRKWAEGV